MKIQIPEFNKSNKNRPDQALITVSPAVHRQLKTLSAKSGLTIRKIVELLVNQAEVTAPSVNGRKAK